MAAVSTPSPSAGPLIVRAVVALIYLGGAALGLLYGYGFGLRIGGALMGVVTALMGAVFCTILLSAALDRLMGWLRAGQS